MVKCSLKHTELPQGKEIAFSVLRFSGIPCKLPLQMLHEVEGIDMTMAAMLFCRLEGGFEL